MSEFITLTDVERQCRVTDLSPESEMIDLIITAVREKGEAVTRRALIRKQVTIVLDAFPLGYLPLTLTQPPLVSVDSISYVDTDGVTQTMDAADYRVITSVEPGYIMPIYGTVWPVARTDKAVVTIIYTCGYTTEDIPKSIVQWALLNVANLYEHRETVIIENKGQLIDLTATLADGLIETYRIHRL